MNTISRISTILKSKKIDQKFFCERIGIKPSVYSDWKSGRNKSYLKRLPEIAEILETSIDYLLGKTEVQNSNIVSGNYNVVGNSNSSISVNSEELTEQETEMLKCFRALSVVQKAKALIYLTDLKEGK